MAFVRAPSCWSCAVAARPRPARNATVHKVFMPFSLPEAEIVSADSDRPKLFPRGGIEYVIMWTLLLLALLVQDAAPTDKEGEAAARKLKEECARSTIDGKIAAIQEA